MIGLIAHASKEEARTLVIELTKKLRGAGIEVLLESYTAAAVDEKNHADTKELAAVCDLVVVLGGDGTLLRAVRHMVPVVPPIFGINIGSLGFLTCLGPQEIEKAIECIANRSFLISHRSMLSVRIEKEENSEVLDQMLALNDAVISRGFRSSLVHLSVLIDGDVLTSYYADGLIIATPTGSTAYSLAAGGPILMPTSGAFVVTPICPHVLTNRSTVVSDKSIIEVCLSIPNQEVNVAVDGQTSHQLGSKERLRLTKSPITLPLAMLPERSFSQVLRQKLKWSGSNF
ncbi:MAG: NAD(+) kinase [Verrucomicrobia bacterium]|nr:MAG: NAD(+) kinase [Verrucomicrobiota bacterium]